MTLETFIGMAFNLLEKTFQLDAATVAAFKAAMWYNDGARVILCHPSWEDVDAVLSHM